MIKAVIFDWDGVLVDTEGCWVTADKRMLAEHCIDYDGGNRHLLTGRNQKECVQVFIEKYGLPLDVEKAIQLRLAKLKEIYATVGNVLMPGALELIKDVKAKGLKLAIASGSSKEILEFLVRKQGVYDYFDYVVSTDAVKNGKPAPDVYLFVAKKLGVLPAHCVVFEDAESGVRSAKAAGMYCIAVPNSYTTDQNFSEADKIDSSLKELSLEDFK